MKRGVWFRVGLALVLVAVVGLLVNVVVFDGHASVRELIARADMWASTPGGVHRTLAVGRYHLPSPGILRVVICPVPRFSQRPVQGLLRVWGPSGTTGHDELVPDKSRGERCFEGSYRTDMAGWYEASLEVQTQHALARSYQVEVYASRRITPQAAWPALSMLLGFALMATAPFRSREQFSADGVQKQFLPPVDWRYSPVLALLAYFAVHVVVVVLSVAYVGLSGGHKEVTRTGTFVAVTLLVQHGMLGLTAAWFLGAFGSSEPRISLGLLPVGRRDVARAVFWGLFLVAIAAVTTRFIRDVSQSPMGQLLEHVPARYALGFGALLAPLSEELFFRGVLVRSFGKRHVTVGVVAGAIVFTLAHAVQLAPAWVGLIPIAAVALVNGWLRVRTGGISQPWLVHTVYNATLSAGLYVS